VDGKNVSVLSDEEFAHVHRKLEENGITIACFGSTVANWGREVNSDLERDLEELRTSIRHMQTAGVRHIRIMSYKVNEPEPLGSPMEEQVITSIRKIVEIAEDNGVVCLHENCQTWGGQSHEHSLRLLEAVDSPALRLVYDTGNPVSMKDVSGNDPYYYQDSYLYYEKVKEFVDYIHIKDAVVENDEPRYVFPGEGGGRVREILKSVAEERPGLPISIEPHVAVVFHDPTVQAPLEERWSSFIDYGRKAIRVAEEAGIVFSSD
jgi:sugar phosphate isomerase/epimerase